MSYFGHCVHVPTETWKSTYLKHHCMCQTLGSPDQVSPSDMVQGHRAAQQGAQFQSDVPSQGGKMASLAQSLESCVYILAASARSTRNAACQHAMSSHSGFAIQRIMWVHFLNKRNALATLRPTGESKQNRSGECIFSGSQIVFCNSLVLLNSCLNYCCFRNCLRPELSPRLSNRDFEHEVTPPFTEAPEPCPHARGSGEHPGRGELLKQQQQPH